MIAELLIVIRTFRSLYKKDIFCAFFYAILFYFCINFSVRYLYAPETLMNNPYILSDFIDGNARFWLQYNLFTFASLISFWFIVSRVRLTQQHIFLRINPTEKRSKIKTLIGISIYIIFTLFNIKLFINNLGSFSYANVMNSTNESLSITNSIQMHSFMLTCGAIAILPDAKQLQKYIYVLIRGIIIINALMLTLFSFLTGNRDTFVSVIYSICIVLLYSGKIKFRQCIPFLILGCIGLFYISLARDIHDESAVMGVLFPNGVSQNMFDTFAVIRHDYVNPFEVVSSTALKSIPKTSTPYLYTTLGHLYTSLDLSDNHGFAHFLFCDGYVFMGPLGFLYNGLVIGGFVVLWRRLASTNDITFNRYMIAVISAMTLMLIRGSGMSSFIKYLYLFILPSIIFYLLLTGKSLALVIHRSRKF